MKRLIKKSTDNGSLTIKEPVELELMDNMTQLNELSGADVRNDRCPLCKYNPLERDDGFKLCPNCGAIYKLIDGEAFTIDKKTT